MKKLIVLLNLHCVGKTNDVERDKKMTNDEKYRMMLLLKITDIGRNLDDIKSIIKNNDALQMFFKKTEAFEVIESMISSITTDVAIHELTQTPMGECEVKCLLVSCKEADGLLEGMRNFISEVGLLND